MRKAIAFALAMTGLALPAAAQTTAVPFEKAVYYTCSDLDRMSKEERTAIALMLADHAAAHYGIRFRDNEKVDRELGAMVRAGCTMFPNAHVFFIIQAAVKAEAEKLKPAPTR
jgi:hypothetical protein